MSGAIRGARASVREPFQKLRHDAHGVALGEAGARRCIPERIALDDSMAMYADRCVLAVVVHGNDTRVASLPPPAPRS